VKHATNAFLATEIEFVNHIADLCGKVGADPMDVAAGLRSDPRIGPNGYTIPGGPPGAHLMRDVNALAKL
jgi:UDPglucose 6-dehydrogenase